jgi:hypothetical protein
MEKINETKFVKDLTNADSSLRGRRAVLLATEIAMAFESKINGLRDEIGILKLATSRSDDMGPETSMSLVVGKDANSSQYVEEVIENKAKLRKLGYQLFDVLESYLERFGKDFLDERGITKYYDLVIELTNMDANVDVVSNNDSDD